jgi:hypothetical protein
MKETVAGNQKPGPDGKMEWDFYKSSPGFSIYTRDESGGNKSAGINGVYCNAVF